MSSPVPSNTKSPGPSFRAFSSSAMDARPAAPATANRTLYGNCAISPARSSAVGVAVSVLVVGVRVGAGVSVADGAWVAVDVAVAVDVTAALDVAVELAVAVLGAVEAVGVGEEVVLLLQAAANAVVAKETEGYERPHVSHLEPASVRRRSDHGQSSQVVAGRWWPAS